eukprot:3436344-Amphidinium_carterae.1
MMGSLCKLFGAEFAAICAAQEHLQSNTPDQDAPPKVETTSRMLIRQTFANPSPDRIRIPALFAAQTFIEGNATSSEASEAVPTGSAGPPVITSSTFTIARASSRD